MKNKKGNGEGSISFESSRNAYRAAVTDPSGQRIIRRFKTKREASEWVASMRADIIAQTYIAPSNITLGEWCVQYLEIYCAPNVRTKTFLRYMQTARHLEGLANIELQQITALMVQRYYHQLDISASAKHKLHQLLKTLFTKAYNMDMIRKNIMVNVEKPRYVPAEVEIFTKEEITKLLTTVKHSEYYERYYTIILMAVTTGMRLGEILGLKARSLHKGYVRVENSLQYINGKNVDEEPKTKASRRKVTISPDLEARLRKEYARDVLSLDGYIFITKNGTPITPRNLERAWHKMLIEAGLPPRRFHALRHTHATQLLADGVPMLEVSRRLGHSDPSHTLRLYGHAIPGYDTKLPERIDRIFSIL